MKYCFLVVVFVLSLISCDSTSLAQVSSSNGIEKTPKQNTFEDLKVEERFKKEVTLLTKFARDKPYNSSIFFLVDLKIPSQYYRFFVYDADSQKIIKEGLTAHGSGSVIHGTDSLKFSNIENSLMSSLGTYEIGEDYQGNFGLAFRLKGLEATNSKALKRYIVLHGYQDAWEKENGNPFYLSWGCPMVAPNFLKTLQGFIKASEKPILLRIYY